MEVISLSPADSRSASPPGERRERMQAQKRRGASAVITQQLLHPPESLAPARGRSGRVHGRRRQSRRE